MREHSLKSKFEVLPVIINFKDNYQMTKTLYYLTVPLIHILY